MFPDQSSICKRSYSFTKTVLSFGVNGLIVLVANLDWETTTLDPETVNLDWETSFRRLEILYTRIDYVTFDSLLEEVFCAR